MAKLSAQQLSSRLKFDFRIATTMNCSTLQVEAYASAANLNDRKKRLSTRNNTGRASHYRLDYRIKSLVARDKFHNQFTVLVDLLAGGNYPFSEPKCQVISTPIPWSPHFTKGAPICIGESWQQQNGRATIGHLMIHIAKLLNFDEPPREATYRGWNGAAVDYWRDVLKYRPITPGLAYPNIDRKILDPGQVKSPQATFRPVRRSTDAPLFKSLNAEPTNVS